MKKNTTGFTIVELLIVIVVIAILAAISVVAYSGVQNRANDTTIQSDLNNLAKKIQIAAVDTGEFPAGGATRSGGASTGNATSFLGFKFTPSKDSYMTTLHNLFYCTGVETTSGQKMFRILARSKSNATFEYTSNGGLKSLGNVAIAESVVCQGMNDPQTWVYGYNYTSGGTWYSWTNG